jgi:exodeoxyribonuclease V alpha subunit
MTIFEQLDAARDAGRARDIDIEFSRWLCGLAGTPNDSVAIAAYLASARTAHGDVCADLGRLADRRDVVEGTDLATPPLDEWISNLGKSPLVGAPGATCPLILDDAGRLYLQRYWRFEQDIAGHLLSRSRESRDVDIDVLRSGLGRLFPQNGADVDWQKVAAASAVLRSLAVISGGPGTGKTTTVVKILALLVEQSKGQPPAIALAAPTGKAAARLQEAVAAAIDALDVSAEVRAAIPRKASTLHKLIGARRGKSSTYHNEGHPLAIDTLVVDEGSMINVALMSKLLRALPATARLVLVGDKDQLSSVEAGALLSSICGDAGRYGVEFGERLKSVLGFDLPLTSGPAGLSDSIVVLRKNYRFSETSGLGMLANLIREGRGAEAIAALRNRTISGATYYAIGTERSSFVEELRNRSGVGYAEFVEAVRARFPSDEVFRRFGAFRVLCSHRTGPYGAEAVNRHIEVALGLNSEGGEGRTWYAGKPVMITENSYDLRLYNGDVGLILPDPADEDRLICMFEGAGGEAMRKLPPARLPRHETAFATTIHKSQGSEFDKTLIVLSPEFTDLLTRELIYTAVTRSRGLVEILCNDAVLEKAIATRTQRSSGLADALGVTPH